MATLSLETHVKGANAWALARVNALVSTVSSRVFRDKVMSRSAFIIFIMKSRLEASGAPGVLVGGRRFRGIRGHAGVIRVILPAYSKSNWYSPPARHLEEGALRR